MTKFEKEMKMFDLKHNKQRLVLKQSGILEALNQVDMSIMNYDNPIVRSIRAYCEKLEEQEKIVDLQIIELEATACDIGEE